MVSLPHPFANIPRTSLLSANLPIIQPLSRLPKFIKVKSDIPALYICREDLNSGLAFGGNKIRKLEYVIHDAVDSGSDTLVTTGGVQSNHMRQTAAVAALSGLKAVLIPKAMVQPDPGTEASYRTAGNVQINSILGAEVLPVNTTPEMAMQIVANRGDKPYWIPAGASGHSLGGLGYARWIFELCEWESTHNVYFDTIFTVCGGGSTLAGMVVGDRLSRSQDESQQRRKRRKFIGVGIFARSASDVKDYTLKIAKGAAEKVGLMPDQISPEDFIIDDRFNAGAYGRLDDCTQETIKRVATSEGILLDPVYTGKSMTGMISMLENGELDDSSYILFVHTGGQAALSAYPQLQ